MLNTSMLSLPCSTIVKSLAKIMIIQVEYRVKERHFLKIIFDMIFYLLIFMPNNYPLWHLFGL